MYNNSKLLAYHSFYSETSQQRPSLIFQKYKWTNSHWSLQICGQTRYQWTTENSNVPSKNLKAIKHFPVSYVLTTALTCRRDIVLNLQSEPRPRPVLKSTTWELSALIELVSWIYRRSQNFLIINIKLSTSHSQQPRRQLKVNLLWYFKWPHID